MTQRTLWRLFPLLIPCWSLLLPAWAAAGPPVTAGATSRAYRISGVVISSRDGSPVPRCRLTVSQTARTGDPVDNSPGNRPNRDPSPGQGAAVGGFAGRGPMRRPGPEEPQPGTQDAEPALTDSRGHFSITVPKAGMWSLTATARGFLTQAYDQHENFWSGIVLTNTAPEIALTFKLTPESAITGIIFDEAGEAVRNAQVTVSPVRQPEHNQGARGNRVAGSATTDDRGRYEVAGLSPGQYKLRVTAHPWYASGFGGNRAPQTNTSATPSPDPSLDVVYPETWFPAASEESSAEVIALSGGEERQADLHLTPVPSVHLRVPRTSPPEAQDGRPQGSRPPTVVGEGGPNAGFYQSVSSPNATEWDFGGLTPGTYQVRIPDPTGQGVTLREVTVAAGSPTLVGLDAATPATTVSLQVEGVDQNAVRGISFVNPATGQTYSANGGRRLRRPAQGDDEEDQAPAERTLSAPDGQYEVYLNGAAGLFLTGLSATGAQITGRTVVLAGGTPKLTIHAATGLGQVNGIARIAGNPAPGAMVLLVPAGYGKPENLSPVRRDETNTDGSFLLRSVFPGPYILVAIDHGWNVNWRDPAVLAQYLAKGTPLALAGTEDVKKDLDAALP